MSTSTEEPSRFELHSEPSQSDLLEGSLAHAMLASGIMPTEKQWETFLQRATLELRKRGIGSDTRRSVA